MVEINYGQYAIESASALPYLSRARELRRDSWEEARLRETAEAIGKWLVGSSRYDCDEIERGVVDCAVRMSENKALMREFGIGKDCGRVCMDATLMFFVEQFGSTN